MERLRSLPSSVLALAVLASGAAAQCELDELTASDGAAGDLFGHSVSLSGDTALVGVPGDDDAGPDSGSAYVFAKQGGLWVETAKLTASDASAAYNFGWSVSLSGDTALVGSPTHDAAGFDAAGCVVARLWPIGAINGLAHW